MRRAPANIRRDWMAFVGAVAARLAAGRRTYRDRSLRAAPAALRAEVESELLDLAGWGFIWWRRLRGLSRRGAMAGRGRRR